VRNATASINAQSAKAAEIAAWHKERLASAGTQLEKAQQDVQNRDATILTLQEDLTSRVNAKAVELDALRRQYTVRQEEDETARQALEQRLLAMQGEMQRELATRNATIDALGEAREHALREVKRFEAQLSLTIQEAQAATAASQRMQTTMTARIEELSEQLKVALEKQLVSQRQLDIYQTQIANDEQEHRRLSEEAATLERRAADLEQRALGLQTKLEAKDATLAEKQQLIDEMRHLQLENQAELARREDWAKRATAEWNAQAATLAQTQKQLELTHAQIEASSTATERSEKQITKQLQDAQAHIVALTTAQTTAGMERVAEQQAAMDQEVKRAAQVKDIIARADKSVLDAKQAFDRMQQDMQEQARQLQLSVHSKNEELETVRNELGQSQQQTAQLRAHVETLESAEKQIRAIHAAQSAALDQSVTEHAAIVAKLQKSETVRIKAKAALESVTATTHELETQVSHQGDRIRLLESQASTGAETVAMLRREYDAEKLRNQQLQQTMDAMQQANSLNELAKRNNFAEHQARVAGRMNESQAAVISSSSDSQPLYPLYSPPQQPQQPQARATNPFQQDEAVSIDTD